MATRLTWATLVAGLVSAGVLLVLAGGSGHLQVAVSGLVSWAAQTVPGVVALALRPQNRAARRLAITGSAIGIENGVGAIVASNVLPLPTGGAWAGLLLFEGANWLSFVAAVAMFAVFPDGRYQRRYERILVAALAVLLVPLLLAWLLTAPRLVDPRVVWVPVEVPSPLALVPSPAVAAVASTIVQDPPFMVLIALGLLVARYRRFGPEQRLQLRWPLYAVTLIALFLVAVIVIPPNGVVPQWAVTAGFFAVDLLLALSLLIGMVRYRLLDIDLVIRRSLVYGVLWFVIAVAYVLTAGALGIAAGTRLPVALAVALTIAATLVFQPARRGLERLADRMVFGRRPGGYQLISRLGARLESAPETGDVAAEVATVVCEGLGAAWVRVVLDRPVRRVVATSGAPAAADDRPSLTAPLVHGGQTFGALECGPKRNGGYRPADENLLRAVGRQAALAIRNSHLTRELSERLEELRASRTRLVEAEETGRRRLERDLHDGVQQEMVGLLARLGLARNQLSRDPARAEATLRAAQTDARRALETIQELARGIHPAVLSDRGLVEALEERAARMTVPVDVASDGLGRSARFSPHVEGAAYFFVSEALANVLKHADAGRAWVRLGRSSGGSLSIEVEDDGRGFQVDSVKVYGLRGLQDRVEALGGRVEFASRSPHGSIVRAVLPTNGVKSD